MHLRARNRNLFIVTAALLATLCTLFSTAEFIADRYAAHAESLLDDPATEDLDVADLSEETLPVYQAAIDAYEKATSFAPLHAGYRASLASLCLRIDIWSETIHLMGSDPGGIMNSGADMRASSQGVMREALMLDPSNVDLHLAMGQQMMARGEKVQSRQQLLRATGFYPVNSPTRFAVAMGLLMMGYRSEARNQARILAENDDSYKMDDDDPKSAIAREQRTDQYVALLEASYLYKALDIIWRTPGAGLDEIEEMLPANVDAREVGTLFLKERCIRKCGDARLEEQHK